MKKIKPIIFWLFAMEEEQKNAVYNCINEFKNAMTKFITVDFEKDCNTMKIVSYNMTKQEDSPYISDIHKVISQHFSISEIIEQ